VPVAEDAVEMARVHVQGWRQTYRGVMSDAVLDDPNLLSVRERFWTGALTDSSTSSPSSTERESVHPS
jgi:hypothetical protein